MTDSRIHDLTDGGAPAATDEFLITRSPYTSGFDRKLTWAELKGVANVVSSSGASLAINISTSTTWDITLTANCTFTLAGFTSGSADYLTLMIRQDGTGSRTVTWPTITWIGTGIQPILQTAPNAVDSVVIWSFDGGTTVFGIAQTSSSGLRSGTSFPGGPSDGDLFYRTDTKILYEYGSGVSRWLSTDRKYVPLTGPTYLQGSTSVGPVGYFPVFEDFYIEAFQCTTRVTSPNNASNYYAVNLYKSTVAASATSIAAIDTHLDTATDWALHTVSVSAIVVASTYPILQVNTSNGAGSPGDLIVAAAMVIRSAG